ncbi:MAG: hypothetical protein RLP15_10505 [Cryomorphaceae bacterium]
MRWIIRLTIIVIIAVVGWFWYPRLFEEKAHSAYALLDASVWMIVDIHDERDFECLTDSAGALIEVDILNQWPLPTEWSSNASLVLFAFEGAKGPGLGILSSNELDWLTDPRFTFQSELGGFHLSATQDYAPDLLAPNLGFNQLQSESSPTLRVYARAQHLLQTYATNLSISLIRMIMNEGEKDMWIEFDLNDEGNVMQATGIAHTSDDQTQRSTDLHLLRFIPANAGLAIVSAKDSLNYGLVHCAYGMSADPYEYLFVLNEARTDDQTHSIPDQNYQGIPISISAVPSRLDALEIPWAKEAYTAHIGNVQIQSASFASLVRLLDDYLADDKLVGSPYFTQIEGAISDAGFTLYVRPDQLATENPFINVDIPWPGTNSLVFQAFSELPGQKFFTVSMLHHKDIVDEAPIVWSALLDTVIQGGPWSFRNHYTNEMEVLVQDASDKLYLINKDGKTLWKKKLTSPIVGNVQMIDLFANGKHQLLFATRDRIQLLDRNGNSVNDFPFKLKNQATAGPSLVRYSSKDKPRILFGDGSSLVNLDEQGLAVKGWNTPSLSSTLEAPIEYLSYQGKDYLVGRTANGKVHFLDRQGKDRLRTIQLDTNQSVVYMQIGKALGSCAFVGSDTSGNLYRQTFTSPAKVVNILPLGSQVGMLHTEIEGHNIVTVSDDHVITLDGSNNVGLDYLLPEAVDKSMQLLDETKEWIGFNARESNHFYILDLDGHMLDKMPVIGKGKAMVIDLNGNGSLELIVSDGKRELKAYSLAD